MIPDAPIGSAPARCESRPRHSREHRAGAAVLLQQAVEVGQIARPVVIVLDIAPAIGGDPRACGSGAAAITASAKRLRGSSAIQRSTPAFTASARVAARGGDDRLCHRHRFQNLVLHAAGEMQRRDHRGGMGEIGAHIVHAPVTAIRLAATI